MITREEGVQRARAALAELLEEELPGLELEEIEESPDSQTWLITFGFWVKDTRPSSSVDQGLAAFLNPYRRKYKTMVVRKDDGEILAMKIREPELKAQ